MKPLIDGDILLYEIGACGQVKQEDGTLEIRSFQFVEELLNRRISEICNAVKATEPPVIYLTGNGNFRTELGKRKVYKGQRKDVEKPFHYHNIKAYLPSAYETVMALDCEADDEIVMAMTENTVCCSRDKDLRQVAGWHYGWECGAQPEFSLRKLDAYGALKAHYYPEGHKLAGKIKKVSGHGLMWFYAQLLMGDVVDHVPGIKGVGPAAVMRILGECKTLEELIVAAKSAYVMAYGENWEEEMLEQGRLVWMIRGRNSDGELIHWEIPDGKNS